MEEIKSLRIDYYLLNDTPSRASEVSKMIDRVKKLEGTIKKEIESSQEKSDTYVYKRAVSSYDYNKSCLDNAGANLERKKEYLREQYEKEIKAATELYESRVFKAQELHNSDITKFQRGMEASEITMQEEKKKKKNKIIISAEYDIEEIVQKLKKMNLPMMNPKLEVAAKPPTEVAAKPPTRRCPCGKGCEDIDKCLMTFKTPTELAMEKRVKKELEEEAEEDKAEQPSQSPLTPFQGLPVPNLEKPRILGKKMSAKPLGMLKYSAPIETI